MKTRELAATLKILRQFGVLEYETQGISVKFRDDPPQFAPPAEVDPNEPMRLPDGVFDPLAKLREINRKVRQ